MYGRSVFGSSDLGRMPVYTRTLPFDPLGDVVAAVERKLGQGAKVYWVCPLVEESESVDLAAATERYELLQRRFGDRVGLVPGRLKGPDEDAVMESFADSGIGLLFDTSFI